MLVISGYNMQTILSAFPTEFERNIITAKNNSPNTYRYENLEELKFELKMRWEIVRAGSILAHNGAQFADFEHSRCNPQFWQLTPNGGFMLNRHVSPAAGIRDIFNNGRAYAFECAVAIVIVLYKAVLEVLGESVFNRLYPGLYLYSWNTDSDLRLIHIQNGEPFPGDIQYFNNPDVSPHTPEFQGENVVVVGPDLYYGHGIGIARGAQIIAALNRTRVPGSTRSAYLMDYVVMPDYRYLQQYSSESPMPYRPYRDAALGVTAIVGARTYAGR